MASYPGSRLEDFIDDLYFHPIPEGTLERWEPVRAEIEAALARYEDAGGDETQSWRAFRNDLAELYQPTEEGTTNGNG